MDKMLSDNFGLKIANLGDHVISCQEQVQLCDAVYRYRKGEEWVSLPCHASVLAAVSPVLRSCLAEEGGLEEEGGLVVVSEWGEEILSLVYSGTILTRTREQAHKIWRGLEDLGIDAVFSITKQQIPPEPLSDALPPILLPTASKGPNTSTALPDTSHAVDDDPPNPPPTISYVLLGSAYEDKDNLNESLATPTVDYPMLTTHQQLQQQPRCVVVSRHQQTGPLAISQQPTAAMSNLDVSGSVDIIGGEQQQQQQSEARGQGEPTAAAFRCDHCEERLFSEVSLATHLADYHSVVRCSDCGLEVAGCLQLVRHHLEQGHTVVDGRYGVDGGGRHGEAEDGGGSGRGGIRCGLCGKVFVTNQALKYHQYKHAGLKPYQCRVCRLAFRTPSTLSSHVMVQHSSSKHKCKVCGQLCSTSGKLKIHLAVHSSHKPFQCVYCSANFKQKSVLKSHEFIHTKESEHRCILCGKCFPTRARLSQHSRKPGCATRPRIKPLPQDNIVANNPMLGSNTSGTPVVQKEDEEETMEVVIGSVEEDLGRGEVEEVESVKEEEARTEFTILTSEVGIYIGDEVDEGPM